MFKQIRTLMSEDIALEGEQVECDEAYIGGKAKNKHLGKCGGVGRSLDSKTTVFGMVERGGRVVWLASQRMRRQIRFSPSSRREFYRRVLSIQTNTRPTITCGGWARVISTAASTTQRRFTCVGMFTQTQSKDFGVFSSAELVAYTTRLARSICRCIATNTHTVTIAGFLERRCLLHFSRMW